MTQARISLSDLRKRTDLQLVALVRGEIEKFRSNPCADAEKSYRRVRSLLSVARTSTEERAELESRLEEIRQSLNRRCHTWKCTAA